MPLQKLSTKAQSLNTVTKTVLNKDGYSVWTEWVDSKGKVIDEYGIAVGTLKNAKRLTDAIHAGVIFTNVKKARSANYTYVDFDCQIIGRRLNADLLRLGF